MHLSFAHCEDDANLRCNDQAGKECNLLGGSVLHRKSFSINHTENMGHKIDTRTCQSPQSDWIKLHIPKSMRRAPLIPRTRCGACAWLQCMQVLRILAKKLADQLLNLPKKQLGQLNPANTKNNKVESGESSKQQEACILHKNIWALNIAKMM